MTQGKSLTLTPRLIREANWGSDAVFPANCKCNDHHTLCGSCCWTAARGGSHSVDRTGLLFRRWLWFAVWITISLSTHHPRAQSEVPKTRTSAV